MLALECLLLLLRVTTCDSIENDDATTTSTKFLSLQPHDNNTTLSQHNQNDSNPCSSEEGKEEEGCLEAHRALDRLMASLGHNNNNNNNNNNNSASTNNDNKKKTVTNNSNVSTTTTTTTTSGSLPPSISSLSSQQQQQWRVQVLQRIDAHIPSLFRTIYTHCNGLPGQQQRLVHALVRLMVQSARFLGCGVEGTSGVVTSGRVESGRGVVSPCYRSLLLLLLKIAATSTTTTNNTNNDEDIHLHNHATVANNADADIDDHDHSSSSSTPPQGPISPTAQRQRLVSAWQGWLLIRAQSISKHFQTFPLLRHAMLTAVQETTHNLAELLDIGKLSK